MSIAGSSSIRRLEDVAIESAPARSRPSRWAARGPARLAAVRAVRPPQLVIRRKHPWLALRRQGHPWPLPPLAVGAKAEVWLDRHASLRPADAGVFAAAARGRRAGRGTQIGRARRRRWRPAGWTSARAPGRPSWQPCAGAARSEHDSGGVSTRPKPAAQRRMSRPPADLPPDFPSGRTAPKAPGGSRRDDAPRSPPAKDSRRAKLFRQPESPGPSGGPLRLDFDPDIEQF